jgi:hypothetical protein
MAIDWQKWSVPLGSCLFGIPLRLHGEKRARERGGDDDQRPTNVRARPVADADADDARARGLSAPRARAHTNTHKKRRAGLRQTTNNK